VFDNGKAKISPFLSINFSPSSFLHVRYIVIEREKNIKVVKISTIEMGSNVTLQA